MSVKLYFGDCLEGMSNTADGVYDIIITDPPYLTTDLAFDKVGFDIKTFIDLSYRTLKQNGYLVSFGSIGLFAQILNTKLFNARFSGVWLKSRGVMRTHNAKKPMSRAEPYVVFCKNNSQISGLTFNKIKNYGYDSYRVVQRKSGYKRGGKDSLSRANTQGFTIDGHVSENDGFRYQTDVIEGKSKSCMPHAERTEHPTQKPINVMETLIKMLTNEGDVVLDPFGGSGTTMLACLNTKRNGVSFEIDPEYYEMSWERVEAARAKAMLNEQVIADEIKPLPTKQKVQQTLF